MIDGVPSNPASAVTLGSGSSVRLLGYFSFIHSFISGSLVLPKYHGETISAEVVSRYGATAVDCANVRHRGATIMSKHHLLALVGACGLASCAAVTEPPSYDGISVNQIVDEVQCELASVYKTTPKQYSDSVTDWVAGVVLDLKVTNEIKAQPTVTITPVITGGTLTVPIGPDFDIQPMRNAEISFDVHMRDLKPGSHAKGKMPDCSQPSGLPEAPDGLGLGAWLSTVAVAAGRSDFASLHGAVYEVKFFVSRGLHGGFTFQNMNVGVDATGSSINRSTDNHLVVTFTADPAAATVAGKTRTSAVAKFNLDQQNFRFLPQRFILQGGTGRLTQ
jgi:hypothetical protein